MSEEKSNKTYKGGKASGFDSAITQAERASRITESERTNELEELSEQELEKATNPEPAHSVNELADIKRSVDTGYETFTSKTQNIYGTKTNRSHLAPTNVFRKKNNEEIKLHKHKNLKEDHDE